MSDTLSELPALVRPEPVFLFFLLLMFQLLKLFSSVYNGEVILFFCVYYIIKYK